VPSSFTVAAPERVLVAGAPGVGKTLVFNAVAGLWPFGTGRVVRPADGTVVFLPERTHLPPGTLRRAIAYPGPPSEVADAAAARALAAMGLDRLVPLLDQDARWDRELGEEELQRLAFVRAALRRPALLVVDELIDSLDPVGRGLAFALFDGDLSGTALVAFGRPDGDLSPYDRVIRLEPAGDAPAGH
jgi:putative ATP-binding cassette transporter